MRFKISLLVGAFFVIFSSSSLYGSVAETGDESFQTRGGFSRAPACDAEEECPVAVEISALRTSPRDENEENRDERAMFGMEPSSDENENPRERND